MVKEDMNFESDPLMGKEVQDIITGFKGLVTGVAHHLTGCTQYAIKPKCGRDGKPQDGVMAEGNRLKVIGQGIRPKVKKKKTTNPKGAMEMPGFKLL